ncbi:MAG: hypothetical protein V7K25_22255 [Nostoc sp.]|uniref:hypothetical protein n=1 Tax=Nostoc sp. TaxID=1180 RepID=UPI002FF575C8
MQTTPARWTTADLELFAGDSRSETLRERKNHYDIIECWVLFLNPTYTFQGFWR